MLCDWNWGLFHRTELMPGIINLVKSPQLGKTQAQWNICYSYFAKWILSRCLLNICAYPQHKCCSKPLSEKCISTVNGRWGRDSTVPKAESENCMLPTKWSIFITPSKDQRSGCGKNEKSETGRGTVKYYLLHMVWPLQPCTHLHNIHTKSSLSSSLGRWRRSSWGSTPIWLPAVGYFFSTVM